MNRALFSTEHYHRDTALVVKESTIEVIANAIGNVTLHELCYSS